MANITPRKNKDGIITSYTIRVFKGRDEKGKKLPDYVRSYPDKKRGESIPESWSQKRIEKEVQKIAILFEEECKSGKYATRKVKFSEFANEFLEMMAATGRLKNSTLVTYEGYMKRINDIELNGIGHLELDKITTQQLNNFYLTLLNDAKSNNRNHKPLSAKYIKRHHDFISSVMTYACKQLIIKSNPCQYATVPIKNENADEKEVIQEKDISNVITAIESFETKWKLFFFIAFSSGARLGEILGIQWCDFDFENNTVHLHNNVQYRKDYTTGEYRIYTDSLKTRQSRNAVLPQYVMNVAKEYAKEKNIINLNSDFFVFTSIKDDRTPMYPSACKRMSDRFKEMAIIKKEQNITFFNHHTKQEEKITFKVNDVIFYKGYSDEKKTKIKGVIGDVRYLNFCEINVKDVEFLPAINPHKFRHTFASLLNYKNIDIITISKSLGHTQVSTTTDVYSHTFNKADTRPAQIFSDLIENHG